MPSPFPGIDPYLEGPHWSAFHLVFSVEIARQLAPKLRPAYTVVPNDRFLMGTMDDVSISWSPAIPDVAVRRASGDRVPSSAAATLEPPLRAIVAFSQEPREVTVEIRDSATRQLVTAIEVISPSNKLTDRGRYLAKRDRILGSSTHLIEIDLVRQGGRLPMETDLPDSAGAIYVSRVEKRPVVEVWPVGLHEALPKIPVPLLPADSDCPLDLQAAYTESYDMFGFRELVRYGDPPPTQIPESDRAWVADRLSAAGLP